MPKIVGYIKGASSQSEAGSYTAEGLPNITGGTVLYSSDADGDPTGAFYASRGYDERARFPNTGRAFDAFGSLFDASRSSSIYGNSAHVTPETSVVLFGVYAFGEITNVGALDAETLATGLSTVEANLSKAVKSVNSIVADEYGNVVLSLCPDMSTSVSATLTTSGFVAPYDCFVHVQRTANWTAGNIFCLNINGLDVCLVKVFASITNATLAVSGLVRKGDTVKAEVEHKAVSAAIRYFKF